MEDIEIIGFYSSVLFHPKDMDKCNGLIILRNGKKEKISYFNFRKLKAGNNETN